MKNKKTKTTKYKHMRMMSAWACVGSGGGVFKFDLGVVAERYPGLLHVFENPLPGEEQHFVPVYILPRRLWRDTVEECRLLRANLRRKKLK